MVRGNARSYAASQNHSIEPASSRAFGRSRLGDVDLGVSF